MIEKLRNKKRIIVISIVIIILLIFFIFFSKNNYKISEIGNTMSNKNIEEIEEYILNISSYEATVEVTVESNKNTNKYVLSQKYIAPNMSKQTVLEPSNLEGIEISYDGQNLSINNSRFNLSKIYENYEYVADNVLFLEAFILDYKLGKNQNTTEMNTENTETDIDAEIESKAYEENDEYVFETRIIQNNEYRQNKKLYIDKNTGKPTKLLVQDINEKTVVYILYNEIKINDLDKNDMLAFKVFDPNAVAI